MQANKGVAGLAISTNFLKLGVVVFEKNENFPKASEKKTDPIHCHNMFFIKQEFVI